MNSHSQFLSQKRFGSLDGLRAISIILVIWHHTVPAWTGEALARIGAEGVTLFFAISGFLITTLLLRERERAGGIDLKAFYLRRAFRIFPIYYGTLLLYIVLVMLLEKNSVAGHNFFENLKYFATYTSNLFVQLDDDRTIFYFAWSLAAEEQFYLIWPLALVLTATVARASTLLHIVSILCILDLLLGNGYLFAAPYAIMLGALLAITIHTKKGFNILRVILGHSWSIIAIAIVLTLSLMASTPNLITHALFTGVVGSCVLREDHIAARLLSWKPIVYIGSISYGMYMMHMLCKNAVTKLLSTFYFSSNGLEVFAFTSILSVVVAGLSFKYYESFFFKLKVKYER